MQSSSSKWLAGAGLVILALIIVSVVVALSNRAQSANLFPQDTPEGTVSRFLLAIEEGETRLAYDYLSSALQDKCTFEHFRDSTRRFARGDIRNSRDTRVTLESAQPIGGNIEVQVRITEFRVSGPFDINEYSYTRRFILEELDDTWRFVDEPWPLYRCPEPQKSP